MNCSVVIPVYRGEGSIGLLADRLAEVLPACAEKFEVLLVDDGSPDGSWDVIEALTKRYPWVRGIKLMRNYGQENATLCGIREACHEVIVTMDDDLQHDPADIPRLIAKLNEGYDVVYGVLRVRHQAWWKAIFSVVVKWAVSSVMQVKTIRDISAYKAFRTELRRAFDLINSPDVQIDVLLSWTTSRFASIEIEESPRHAGTSNYTFIKLIKVSLLVLTNYTTVPLRIASIVGFLFTLIGVFVMLYVMIVYFTLGSIPGFTFVISAVTIFSGVQLFALGIIGEYLVRTFECSSGKPPYAIQKTTGEAP